MKPTKTISRMAAAMLLSALPLLLPAQTRYYLSFSDLLADKGTEAAFTMQQRSAGGKGRHLGGDYKPRGAGGKLKNVLKHKARFVEYNGKLYVNSYGLRSDRVRLGKWYAPVWRAGAKKIVFTSVKRNRKESAKMPSLVDALLNSYDERGEHQTVLERAVNYMGDNEAAKKRASKVRACYLMYSDDASDIRIIDSAYMRVLLQYRPDLTAQYMQMPLSVRESPEVVIAYLQQAGVVSQD